MNNIESFIPWDNMLNKKYTKEQMLSFAEHCMTKLVTKYPNGKDEMGEISSEDLSRIREVLNEYSRKTKQR